ncbi:MAG: hypothetical protein JWP52_1973 [Rhizobacter sp.]|nr:hypothetical protein [Rhizobacter sp.]
MANSSITGGRNVIRSHGTPGTADLGPSDTSDSGSDISGGIGLAGEELDGLDRFPDSDIGRGVGGGADIGDPNLDSDSDASGTGERAAAGRDSVTRDGSDISTDSVFSLDDPDVVSLDDPDNVDIAELAVDEDDPDLDGESIERKEAEEDEDDADAL